MSKPSIIPVPFPCGLHAFFQRVFGPETELALDLSGITGPVILDGLADLLSVRQGRLIAEKARNLCKHADKICQEDGYMNGPGGYPAGPEKYFSEFRP